MLGQGYIDNTDDNIDWDMDNLVESRNRTVIVANFGQWPAGWSQGYPWSLDKYKTYVEADVICLE